MTPILKQPYEAVDVPLAIRSPATAVVSCTAIKRDLVVGSAAIEASAAIGVADDVIVSLTGGTDGEHYLVTVRYTAEAGELEDELEVAVLDAGWAMPDGGVAYLTIVEFVERFGLAETITMTDGDGSGRIDRSYLIGALRAAQGEVDLALAARYAVPLAAVPEAIKGLVADRARMRLYPRGAPEGVAQLARSAERTLERIASGALPLPLPAGQSAAPAESHAPVMISGRGKRAYPNGLDDLR